ncbi:LPXTG-motif cell wall anchor domain-containing protein [Micromonospora cremea]|uniref:LPXTG-motif cell wall anchor domain-containing protein n=1 Tax=Micromonospora cremea TaxID=709881 RepID=A0A1N5ZX46_9ACTN|nr:LPXTG-motif cell wall anchor domain-containing protein [Micromonospora cremea]
MSGRGGTARSTATGSDRRTLGPGPLAVRASAAFYPRRAAPRPHRRLGAEPTKTPTTPPTIQPAEPRDCEAYVYTGTTQNLCADFPNPPGTVNCSDVKYRVTLVDVNNDPWGLDGNRGTPGFGCESNPLKPNTALPTTSPAPGAGGGLPVTGVNATALGAVGVIAVLAGVALVVARRRRVRFDA